MARFDLFDAAGQPVGAIVAREDQIAAFIPEGGRAVLLSPEDLTDGQALRSLRQRRDALLVDSDWVEAASLPPAERAAWRFYRDRLRNLTEEMTRVQDVPMPVWQPLAEVEVKSLSDADWRSLINLERDRRIAETFWFLGHRFDFDEVSKARVTGAATLAGFALAAGTDPAELFWQGTDAPFVWITAGNAIVPMDAGTCFGFGRAAARHEAGLIFAARALKEAAARPADWFDDTHWAMEDPNG